MRLLIATTCGLALGFAISLRAGAAERREPPRELELAASNDTLQLRYLREAQVVSRESDELAYALFLSEDHDLVAAANLLVEADLGFGEGLELHFGPQVYAALLSEENNDVFAFAVGAQVRWEFVPSRGIAVVARAYYAPDVVTFGSADKVTDYIAQAEMRLTRQIVGLAGFRRFELDLPDQPNLKLQNEVFVGFRWPFR